MELARNRFAPPGLRQTRYGLWLGLPDTTAAEIAAGAGFDWLLIDHEHAPLSCRAFWRTCRPWLPYDVAPIVRPVDDSPSLLKKLWISGADFSGAHG